MHLCESFLGIGVKVKSKDGGGESRGDNKEITCAK